MSIAVLTQVHEEARRLAIAGSNLAQGDFRLKKLAPPLEASAAKAPVFGKVAEGINKLIESDAKNSAAALLELSTLVSAVLYTQGETGAAGEWSEIDTVEFDLPTNATSARLLKPLIEALTTTGSGREEIIKDAHTRGAFKDLRLVRLAVRALDDVYAPIADFVAEHVLPMYGRAIYDDLQASFSPKAKGAHVRRLRLMHRLDPERTHEYVEQSLEQGSPEMKVAAIECLAGREESLSFLLEQAQAKSANVRRAAYNALAKFDHDEVIETLMKALAGKDLAIVVDAASESRSPKLLAHLLAEAEKGLAEIQALKDKEKLKKALAQLHELLGAFASRDDKQSLALLTKAFERREALSALPGDVSGQDLVRRIGSLLIHSGHEPSVRLVASAHDSLTPANADLAALAGALALQPRAFYDTFSPYFLATTDRKKKSDGAAVRRDAVRSLVVALSREGHYYGYYGYGRDYFRLQELAKNVTLDPRWLDAAIAANDLELVQQLARPQHPATQKYLAARCEELLQKKGDPDHNAWQVLETMLRIEHPRGEELFFALLDRVAGKKQHYYSYWLVRLIPMLPKTAGAKIEALLPSLHEKLADQLVPYLAELQAKAEK